MLRKPFIEHPKFSTTLKRKAYEQCGKRKKMLIPERNNILTFCHQNLYLFTKLSYERSLSCSPVFSYLEAFENNSTSDWLNYKVLPIKSCALSSLQNLGKKMNVLENNRCIQALVKGSLLM